MAPGGIAATWPADVAVPRRPLPNRDAAAARFMAPPVPLVDTPGAFVVTPERLIDWAIEAEDGARCVYARVFSMAHQKALRDCAQNLAARRVLQINVVRHEAGDGLFDQVARRTASPWQDAPPPAPPSDDVITAEARRVLELLVRVADDAGPCPNNRAIANSTGLRDADAAAYQLRRLAELGFIIRKPIPVEPGRIITIVETGAHTGMIGR